MNLTQKAVDDLALDTDRVIWDKGTPGLGLRVQSRKKSWIVRYRVAGAQRQKSLPGNLSLKKARAQAGEIRAGATRGADIIEEGRAEAEARKREAEAAKARQLGPIIEKYLAAAPQRLRPASLKVARIYLEGSKDHLRWQLLKDRPADELTRREVLGVLENWSGKVTAAQMLHHLSACLSWAVEKDLIDRNCVIGIKPPVEKVSRERVLTDDEIRQLWAATTATGGDTIMDRYAKVLRVLLLTGQRRGEVGGMCRTELDLDRQVWRLPSERTKNALPHDVPLSQQVLEIIQAPELTAADHLFGRNGFNAWHWAKRQLDAHLPLAPWTVHDLRRTVVTGMAEIGIAPHIVEAIVNHVSGHKGGVAGVYNRAKYSQEKRAALQRWADHVERLVAGGAASNVVSMAR